MQPVNKPNMKDANPQVESSQYTYNKGHSFEINSMNSLDGGWTVSPLVYKLQCHPDNPFLTHFTP